jgi:sugar phosphate isomerase/epimerase
MRNYSDRFSCADFTFPLLPHEKALRLIKLLGINAVDLGFFVGRSHLRPEHAFGNGAGAAKAVSALLSDLGLELADVFLQTGADPDIDPANHPEQSVRNKTRDLFKSAIEVAHATGCHHLTGLPGVSHAGVSDADSFALAADEASWRAAEANRAGVVYAVEAHVGSICPSPETTLEFLQRSQGVTLTLDYGHFIYQGMTNESVHALLPYASHFHARAGCKGRLQALLKNNAIDFASILAGLRQAAYKGFICLEYVWVDWEHCNEVDNVSETILLRDHLSQIELAHENTASL